MDEKNGPQCEQFQVSDEYRKNLTRFTYEKTAFQGWRLCISRGRKTMVKYFSDKRYGNSNKALEAAEETLRKLRLIFETSRVANNGKVDDASVRLAQAVLDGLKRDDVDHRRMERGKKLRLKEEAKKKRAAEARDRSAETRKRPAIRRRSSKKTGAGAETPSGTEIPPRKTRSYKKSNPVTPVATQA